MATIWQQAEELKDEMVERRRDLHQTSGNRLD